MSVFRWRLSAIEVQLEIELSEACESGTSSVRATRYHMKINERTGLVAYMKGYKNLNINVSDFFCHPV